MISKEDIQKAFASLLDKIDSEELRQKTVEVWVDGAKKGGWDSIEELEKVPFSLLTDCRGVNLIEHTNAVTAGALALAKAQEEYYSKVPYKVDYDRLVVGGLLHDVGKLMEIERDGNGGYRKSHSGRCASPSHFWRHSGGSSWTSRRNSQHHWLPCQGRRWSSTSSGDRSHSPG